MTQSRLSRSPDKIAMSFVGLLGLFGSVVGCHDTEKLLSLPLSHENVACL